MPTLGFTMVHAGLAPQWDLAMAQSRGARGGGRAVAAMRVTLFDHMYGNKPDQWDESSARLRPAALHRQLLYALALLRRKGRIDLKLKGAPSDVARTGMPWFQVPGRASKDLRIVCGHWSTLGYYHHYNVHAIDTGCVWGGSLCAIRLDEARDPVRLRCRTHQKADAD